MRRSAGGLKICVFYVAFLVLYAVLGLPFTGILGMLLLVVIALFASELDRSGGLIAVPILKLAGRLLVSSDRQDHVDEWIDQIRSEGEAGLRPVFTAIGIAVRATPRVALRQRHVPLRCQTHIFGYALGLIVASSDLLGIDEKSGPEQRVSVESALLFVAGAPALGLYAILAARRHQVRRELVAVLGLAIWLAVGIAGPFFTPGTVFEQTVRGVVVFSLTCVTVCSASIFAKTDRLSAYYAWLARFVLWLTRRVGLGEES